MIGKDIAAAAGRYPAVAFEAISRMVESVGASESMNRYDLMERAVPDVIAAALNAEDSTLKEAATKLRSDLGHAGYIDLAEKVEAALRSRQNTIPGATDTDPC